MRESRRGAFFYSLRLQISRKATGDSMARTKFTFEKRQREIARQQKQKDKAARRAEAKQSKDETEPGTQSEEPGADDQGGALPTSEEGPDKGM